VEDKRRRVRHKKISTADQQYMKVMSLRKRKKSSKDLTQDLRDASGPSVDPSTVQVAALITVAISPGILF